MLKGRMAKKRRFIMLRENFDASQFITFDISGPTKKFYAKFVEKFIKLGSGPTKDFYAKFIEKFRKLGFEVIFEDEIRNIKKVYFRNYRRSVFIELFNQEFIGEFEEWDKKDDPSPLAKEFAASVKWLYEQKNIYNLKVIFTLFAEEGKTKDGVVKSDIDNIINVCHLLSHYNFGERFDNLIIEIIPKV